VDIAVADSSIGNIKSHIMCTHFAAVELKWNEWLASFHDGI
jgi:hypothetical protein